MYFTLNIYYTYITNIRNTICQKSPWSIRSDKLGCVTGHLLVLYFYIYSSEQSGIYPPAFSPCIYKQDNLYVTPPPTEVCNITCPHPTNSPLKRRLLPWHMQRAAVTCIPEWDGKRSMSPQRASLIFNVPHSITSQWHEDLTARPCRHLRVFPFSRVWGSLIEGTLTALCSKKNGICQSKGKTVVEVYLFPFATFETSNSLSSLIERGESIRCYLQRIHNGNSCVGVKW